MTTVAAMRGGCQCGAVRYSATGTLRNAHICHCRMCQKAAGNYFLPLAAALRTEFALTRGAPKWFQSSALVRRGFCANCGTPLFYDIPAADFINIALGSLDDPGAAPPVTQSNTSRKMSWFHTLDTLPLEAVAESGERVATIAASNRQHPDHDTTHWLSGAQT